MKNLADAAQWLAAKSIEDGVDDVDEAVMDAILQIFADRTKYLKDLKADLQGNAAYNFQTGAATQWSHALRLDQFSTTLGPPVVLRIPIWTGSVRRTVVIIMGEKTTATPENVTLPVELTGGTLFCGSFYGGDTGGDPDSAPSAKFVDSSTIFVRPNARGASTACWIAVGYL